MMKRKQLLLGLVSLSLLGLVTILLPAKAEAIIENGNEIPGTIQNIMTSSDCRQGASQFRYAQFSWLSPAGSAKVDSLVPSVVVSPGQDVLGMWLNNLTAVCNNNINGSGDIIHKDKSVTRSRVTSATIDNGLTIANFLCGGTDALNNSYQDLNYGSAYLFKLRYVVEPYPSYTPVHTPFCLKGLAGLSPGFHTVTITTTVRTIHQGTGGDYSCVELVNGAVRAANGLDDGGCGTRTATLNINLRIGDEGTNTQPDGRIDGISCGQGGLAGWAIDPDSPTTPSRVDFYDGPLGTGRGVGSATADRPHNPSETLPYGNPNARFLLDFRTYPSLYRGTHTLYAYAIDTAGGPFRDLNSGAAGFGPITFTYKDICGENSIPSSVINIVPKSAAGLDDDENPLKAVFESGISTGAPADGTVTRRLYIRRGTVTETIPGQPGSENRRLDGFDYPSITIDNPQTTLRFATLGGSPFSPGDEICIDVSVNPRQVRVYLDGVVEVTDGSTVTNTSCDRFVNKPFLSAYGGDVSAGGGFGTTCSVSNAGINTNNNAALLGSGVEFAAQAVGVISGFSSARLTSPPKALAFSNNTAQLGNFSAGHCIKDYFSEAPASVTAGSEVFPSSLTPADDALKYGSGAGSTTTLRSGNLNNGVRTSLYIDGDLIIDGTGIGYASASWTDTKQIPSLHVYVSGNIWIQSTVTNLNGMFVAQPRSGVADSGRIITCASGSARVSRTDLFNVCGNRLVVNGGLVADRVDFLRAGSSMRKATTTSEGSASLSEGAEVINLSPEFIMVAPDHVKNIIKKDYQFFTTLPPVL